MSLPHVTDHAVLRYLERVIGFDMEVTRRHIALICAEGVNAGATSIKVEGVQFKIKDRAVITITPVQQKPGTGHSIQRIRGRA